MEKILAAGKKDAFVSLITVADDLVAIILSGKPLATVNNAGGAIAFFIFGVWIIWYKNRFGFYQYTVKVLLYYQTFR
jgi:hypothetical protein